MKKAFISVFALIFLFLPIIPATAATKNIYFFYGNGCPHCAKEEVFLKNVVEEKYPNININRYEVSDMENAQLLKEAASKISLKVSGVPVLIVGNKAIVGFHDDKTTGSEILALLEEYDSGTCEDAVASIFGKENDGQACEHGCEAGGECEHDCGCSADSVRTENISQNINIPFLGDKDIKSFSLPVLTVIIGILDGFNPCAMWVLVFLITLLLGMQNRKKMWTLGLAFIITSGVVYLLFLAAWLTIFQFIKYIEAIKYIVGIVAIGSGIYHLKEYFTNKEAVCKVTGGEKKKKVFDRLKQIISQKSFALSLIGIIMLAAIVNLVEVVCSAGLPAVYTHVLSISDMPIWQYYGYLLLYIVFFMLDDMIVFFIAMTTLKLTGISTKYTRYSNIIGGVIILIIGILLIFKPGWLMF